MMSRFLTITYLSLAGMLSTLAAEIDLKKPSPLSVDEVIMGYKKNAALTQYHRWFLLYENPAIELKDQLSILAEDVHLKSALGEANGKKEYSKRALAIPKTWKNAHHVKSVRFRLAEDKSIHLDAKIVYQNLGRLPDGKLHAVFLNYATVLKPQEKSVLPLFTSIKIKPAKEQIEPKDTKANKVDLDHYSDAYAENRVRSLIYYWLALVENPKRDVTPFKQVLAPGFELNFSSGVIDSFEKFSEWYKGPASSVKASTHVPKDIKIEKNKDGTYTLKVKFLWHGILPNDKEMTAVTNHTWKIVDNPKELFPRITNMDVKVLQPFSPFERKE